jgi:dihydroorotate dehydrogenase (NAD+) catalytic subunit
LQHEPLESIERLVSFASCFVGPPSGAVALPWSSAIDTLQRARWLPSLRVAKRPYRVPWNPVESVNASSLDLSVRLGRLQLPNPIMVASGTFGYAREMEGLVSLGRLGGIIPKTITAKPRAGNAPWRTVETAAGMLNSIGLDNDGIETFIAHHLPYLAGLGVPIVVSIAGHDLDEFVALAARLDGQAGVAALELNISCPNVAGGVDFGTDPLACRRVVAGVRKASTLPILAKLTPNVTDIASIAKAAADGGADAIAAVNTCLGLAVDWRRRKPLLGNGMGGLSGPAIKPIALCAVYQVAQAVDIPVVGIGGIATIADAMEFFVAGASAVEIGTANFYNPMATMTILDELPAALAELGASRFTDIVGTLDMNPKTPGAA